MFYKLYTNTLHKQYIFVVKMCLFSYYIRILAVIAPQKTLNYVMLCF